MRNVAALAFLFISFFHFSVAQSAAVVAGPMIGQVELRTAKIWLETKPGTTIRLWYWKKGNTASAKSLEQKSSKDAWFAPHVFDLVALDFNTTYEFQVTSGTINNKSLKAEGTFTTKDLWQYRKPAPDFTFLTGSCHYTNDPFYDRPGAPYGKDSTIFETMTRDRAAFMLWLGDNWYLREVDYSSDWGIWYRAHQTRVNKIIQPFMKAMPHYAIWDDHDFGPNDSDKSFHLKETSRKVFQQYWANPSYGEGGQGIYTKFSYGDVDFFLMDDRYFRTSDEMQPTIDGKPNASKRMWGEKQMEWLKNSLRHSHAPFKVIVTGSQTLNTTSPYDCLQDFPVEFEEFMSFINFEKITGILFFTGDRHHSEVIRYERAGNYPLYDITSSPLTSSVGKVGGKEKDNPARVAGSLVEQQNYSRVKLSGLPGARMLTVEYVGIKGELLGKFSVNETELRVK